MKEALGVFVTVVVGWIVFNLLGAFLVGLIARAAFRGKVRVGWFRTLVVGFLGGLLGRLVFWLLRWPSGFPMDFVASVAGAFVLLLAYQLRANRRGGAAK